MAIDRFSLDRFEAALPVHNVTGAQLWSRYGFLGSERLYGIAIPYDSQEPKVMIWIMSSMGADGWAMEAGENSIRCWLGTPDQKPLSNKRQSYITRVKGWETRLRAMLKVLYRMGLEILNPCPHCGAQMSAFWCNQGENEGRRFVKCMACKHPSAFRWLDPKKEKVA